MLTAIKLFVCGLDGDNLTETETENWPEHRKEIETKIDDILDDREHYADLYADCRYRDKKAEVLLRLRVRIAE